MSLSVIMFFLRHCIEQVLRFVTWYPCQQSAQLNCNLNPCLSITMSKRFFDCSLTADAPNISFVPQKWCRSSRECIAAPDVLTMCQEAEFTKFRNGIGYSASELKTIERCVSSRSSSDVVTDVQTHHNDVQRRTNASQKYNNRTNGKWVGARATNKSKPHWSTCFLLNTLESGK